MTLRRLLVITIACFGVLLAVVAASVLSKPDAHAQGINIDIYTPVAGASELEVDQSQDSTDSATPTATPQPTATPTPFPTPIPVEPPVWVEMEIPEPTPIPYSDRTPLPMLTNIETLPRDGSVVYLTFDDGPNPTYTNQILDLLAQYNAKATFFVLGNAVDAYPGTAARIVSEGHTIANHTYHHIALPTQTSSEISETLTATSNAITRATGKSTTCFRPPYGSLNQPSYETVSSLGYSVVMWDVDSNDWRGGDSYSIAAEVLRKTRLGSTILFHDGPAHRGNTVAAVASVLEVLSAQGVTFAALPCS